MFMAGINSKTGKMSKIVSQHCSKASECKNFVMGFIGIQALKHDIMVLTNKRDSFSCDEFEGLVEKAKARSGVHTSVNDGRTIVVFNVTANQVLRGEVDYVF